MNKKKQRKDAHHWLGENENMAPWHKLKVLKTPSYRTNYRTSADFLNGQKRIETSFIKNVFSNPALMKI